MTNQTKFSKCLGGSPAGASISRLCTLTLAAILAAGGAVAGFAQDHAGCGQTRKTSQRKRSQPLAPHGKVMGGYLVHSDDRAGRAHRRQQRRQRCHVGHDGEPDDRRARPGPVTRRCIR